MLIAGLADLTAAPGDAFDPDMVAVPSKGVERWISQSLSACPGYRCRRPGRCLRERDLPLARPAGSDAVAGGRASAPMTTRGRRVGSCGRCLMY